LDLNIGEYAVHINYGIGYYRGMKKIDTRDGSQDHLILEYADGDRLYVPYKYMHLVVLLVRILISETYQNEYRVFKWDQFFIPMVLLSAIISIIEKVSGAHLGLLYLMILLGLIWMLAMFIVNVIKDSKDHLKEKMHPKHVDAYEKSKHFTLGVFYSLYAIAIVAFITCIVTLNIKTTFLAQGGNTTLSQLLTMARADLEDGSNFDGYWADVVVDYGIECHMEWVYNYDTREFEEIEVCEIYEITECRCVWGGHECLV